MRKVVFVALMLVSTSLFGEPRGLIVVNYRYKHRNYNVASLKDVEVARQIAHALGFRDDQLKILVNATRDEFLRAWQWLKGAGENDAVFFYFSGEGVDGIPDSNGDEPDGYDEGIVMVDEDTLRAVILDDVFDKLQRRLKAKKKLFILDCCFAGLAYKGIRRVDASGTHMASDVRSRFFDDVENQRFAVLYAGLSKVSAPAGNGPSPFSNLLLHAIVYREADLDGDRLITLDEVARFIQLKRKSSIQVVALVSPIYGCANLLSYANPRPEYSLSCIKNAFLPGAAPLYITLGNASGVYHTGDVITLDVIMPYDGYIYVFEMSADNEFRLIFPLSENMDNWAHGGETVRISPDRVKFRAMPPYGESVLIVATSRKPLSQENFLPTFGSKDRTGFYFTPTGLNKLISTLSYPGYDVAMDAAIVTVEP